MILRNPREIDEYAIDKPVGGSKNFTVYHASDAGGRSVALKAALNRSAQDLAHLRREREVGRHLLIPGLRQVRHVGQSADGHIYAVMDWAEHTLREEMNKRRHFNRDAVLKYLTPIAQTLDEMHARGFVHCDVTPDHILFTDDGRVLLSGIAQARRRGQHPAPGDARYSAPERNTAQPTGPWSDIYSLGVIAYEMLTGRLPFPGASDEELRRNHAVLTPTLPRSVRRSLGRDAGRAVLRALAKEPADRFHSATAFIEGLRERESTSLAVQHGLTDLFGGVGAIIKRTPRALKIFVLALMMLGAGAAVVVTGLPGEDPPPDDPRTATAEFLAALSTPVTIWTAQPVSSAEAEGTATPAASESPSVTATAVATAAPTPTENAAPTATPVPTAASGALHSAPGLLEPADVTHFSQDDNVDFVWSFTGQLRQGESFDLRVWRQGEPAWGVARTTTTEYRLRGAPNGPGEYSWQVVVVRDDADGKVVETSRASAVRRVFWD